MNFEHKDFDNITEALEQISFRCQRNINILNDLIFLTDSKDAKKEKLFLENKLMQYQCTLGKVSDAKQMEKKNAETSPNP